MIFLIHTNAFPSLKIVEVSSNNANTISKNSVGHICILSNSRKKATIQTTIANTVISIPKGKLFKDAGNIMHINAIPI